MKEEINKALSRLDRADKFLIATVVLCIFSISLTLKIVFDKEKELQIGKCYKGYIELIGKFEKESETDKYIVRNSLDGIFVVRKQDYLGREEMDCRLFEEELRLSKIEQKLHQLEEKAILPIEETNE